MVTSVRGSVFEGQADKSFDGRLRLQMDPKPTFTAQVDALEPLNTDRADRTGRHIVTLSW